jgi:energy-coupling factor transporter ATP-binding protein EcfA2
MSLKDAQIIGIHGPLNSGKDTIASIIQQLYPERYRRYAFAKPIKDAVKVMFGFTDIQVEDRALKEAPDQFWGFSPRKAMQLLGTEFGRELLRDDVWVKRAELEIASNKDNNYKTIITDVRFENEAEWIRNQPNSVILFIESPGLDTSTSNYKHASEGGISVKAGDYIITNDKRLGFNTLFSNTQKLFE